MDNSDDDFVSPVKKKKKPAAGNLVSKRAVSKVVSKRTSNVVSEQTYNVVSKKGEAKKQQQPRTVKKPTANLVVTKKKKAKAFMEQMKSLQKTDKKILAKDRARLSSKSSVAKDSSSDEDSLWEDFLTSDSFAFDKEKKDNDDDDAPCGQQAQVQN